MYNHPFVDGNKRTGFEAMRLVLRMNGYDIKASAKAKFECVMGIAAGSLPESHITDWLSSHSTKLS
ncbi:MAG: type II toxin-antitoxin system death-on-curing family toxin [Candidatus Omnitrophota bacterium]